MWSPRGTSSAEKGKPQRKQPREGGREGARGTTEESTKTQNPFPPFFVFTFVWGCHTESPANSLAGSQSTFSRKSGPGPRPGPDLLSEELQGRGLPGDLQSQFWEWCPLDLKSTAPVRPPTGRILDDIRPSMYDLGHRANFDSATTSAIMQLSAVTQTPATMQFSSMRPSRPKAQYERVKIR